MRREGWGWRTPGDGQCLLTSPWSHNPSTPLAALACWEAALTVWEMQMRHQLALEKGGRTQGGSLVTNGLRLRLENVLDAGLLLAAAWRPHELSP